MVNLTVAYYAMSGQYHHTTAGKWLANGRGGRDCFLTYALKQRILRGSVENMTVLLPLDLPAQHCTDEFYSEHVRHSLVLLCCDGDGDQQACVALGVFVGDGLWANTLDPALRFRGRRDNFNPALPIVDANHVLAPVHIVTTLLRRDVQVTLESLVDGNPSFDLALFVDQRLPQQLRLVVADVQGSLAAAPMPPGTPQHLQASLARAVRKALEAVREQRSDDAGDADRVAAVAAVLRALDGLTAPETLPATKRQKLAARKAKKASQETRRLLAEAARNTRNSMALIYNDYDHLAMLHSSFLQL